MRHSDVGGTVPRMTTPVNNRAPMTAKSVRVPDQLWEAAQLKANENGEPLSVVVRKALERYVARR